MVAVSPEQLQREAVCYFREPELPESLSWVAQLDPVNVRLFDVELSDAIKEVTLTGDSSRLIQLLDAWRGTAEVDAVSGLTTELLAAKEYEPFDR